MVLALVGECGSDPAAAEVFQMATGATMIEGDRLAFRAEFRVRGFGGWFRIPRQHGEIRTEVADIRIGEVGHDRVRPAAGPQEHELPLYELVLLTRQGGNPWRRGNPTVTVARCADSGFFLACRCIRRGASTRCWQQNDCRQQNDAEAHQSNWSYFLL
ncbi:MAG TPA: hypothetical protein VGM32_16585 [Rhodopila sp.]|jgi:hypothetical protein